jgi:hypothetical protein
MFKKFKWYFFKKRIYTEDSIVCTLLTTSYRPSDIKMTYVLNLPLDYWHGNVFFFRFYALLTRSKKKFGSLFFSSCLYDHHSKPRKKTFPLSWKEEISHSLFQFDHFYLSFNPRIWFSIRISDLINIL